jgi:hypothetical protein
MMLSSLKNYNFEPSSRSRLHKHGYKSILGDAKKVMPGKILVRYALDAPMLPIGRCVG